ncbi:hypothetical protein HGRIS_007717 [Hohenbuehelia grisea]|uniref:Amino acid transporter transmembrane domain-containing protein n=1 Tax=Hohenbuehelia grisea TaxID=104357 RepID=A0ABR3J5R3_9AGAR
MTSVPKSLNASIPFGSASSAQSVRDAIASYRRSQYLIAGSAVCSAADTYDSLSDEDEEEDNIRPTNELSDDDLVAAEAGADRDHRPDGLMAQLDWDDIEEEGERPDTTMKHSENHLLPVHLAPPIPGVIKHDEGSPLLHKASRVSFGATPHPRRDSSWALAPPGAGLHPEHPSYAATQNGAPRLVRRLSAASTSKKISVGGTSTYGQTLFNSIAILLGIGMLSEPLAFSYAGWFAGTAIIAAYGFIACYTAKILARIIMEDPRLRSYSDIGRKAFGHKAQLPISLVFCLELFAVSVVLVTLYADSLHTIIPAYSADTYKIWGLLILLPTVFLPLSLLSYASILGILSIALLIAVIVIDGLSKTEAPGSLWSPAETFFGVQDSTKLGLAFGLFMAGFSGHAVIPSLARDMVDPTQFDSMINWAFISMDLLNTPGFNPILNQAALWMLVISPLSKFALATQPLNATLEILLGIDSPLSSPEEFSGKSSPYGRCIPLKKILHVVQRVTLTLLAVGFSILVPEFSSVMAFLGSFSAFLICVIGPVGAKVALARHCGWFDGIVLVIGIAMAVWGTLAAVWTSS